MTRSRLLLLAVIIAAVVAFFAFDLGRYVSLAEFQAQRAALDAQQAAQPLVFAAAFLVVYVVVAALSLPGAAILTLVGGALFGFGWGLVLVSFGSTLGATLAFLSARLLLRDAIQRRFARQLAPLNRGVEKNGAFYLFTLRLVPLFPFFVVNLALGLTPIRVWTFYWVSQLGMLAGTAVFVNAGTQLGALESTAGLISPTLLASFALLGVFPWIARSVLGDINRRRALEGHKRPARFDANLIVVGAGSAGLVTAYIAAAVRARVMLIERERMGGDCLNTGCVPSKALLRSAKFASELKRARDYGFEASGTPDFAAVMARVRCRVADVAPHDSVERYSELGVECVTGDARVVSPWEVEVNGQRLAAKRLVIATGARPLLPPIPGLLESDPLTSDNVWSLDTLPPRLAVLGGGPIGCELAQAFARLGSQVTLIEAVPRLLPREDQDVSALIADKFAREGITVRTGCRALRVGKGEIVIDTGHGEASVPFDRLLVALGRAPNSRGFGLEEIGVGFLKNGAIEVDAHLATAVPTISACGDVAGPYQFTHVAAHQAWYAAVNSLFGAFRRFRVDYSVIPWATFCDPEVARVGLNETDATAQGVAFEVTQFDLAELDRAIVDDSAHGFVKVLTVPGRDHILGATIVGAHAGELIAEFTLAMRHGLGLNKLLDTIHLYPSFMEANKYVAGQWRRAHAPTRLLGWVERYLRWQRGGSALPASMARSSPAVAQC